MKTAIVHDWLTGMRGGEKVLRQICELYPQADIFTLIHVPGSCPAITRGRKVVTSWLNRLPAVQKYYRYLLPLMPRAIESLDFKGYDLILSTSHCVAKGLKKTQDATHVCYCHSPMRYIWSMQDSYRQTMGTSSLGLKIFGKYLRKWDINTVDRVDSYIANSGYIAQRIKNVYGRDSHVIYPPVDTDYYSPDPSVAREDFYLIVSALAPYKRVDQAIEVFRHLPDKRLVIIGTGQQAQKLKASAGDNVEFLGWADDQTILSHYRRCRALLFPGEEDFGIIPVEAMATGAPVIAYDKGGVCETVCDINSPAQGPPTGLRYNQQTAEGLLNAIRNFERISGDIKTEDCIERARYFSNHEFQIRYRRFIEQVLRDKHKAC